MVKAAYLLLLAVAVSACGFNDRKFNDRSCSADQDCPRPDQSCVSNACVQKTCGTNADCGPGFAFECTAGGCVAQSCSTAADCGLGFACGNTGYCQASFNVTAAASLSNTSISVTFDAPPDVTSATTLTNYTVDGLTLSGTPTLSGSTVTLTTSSQTVSGYNLTVSGVTRASDRAPLIIGTASFTGRASFNVTSATATSARSVVLTFDAPPDDATATTVGNYAIDNNLSVTGTPVVTGNTVTLTTSAQALAVYTATVANVRRASDGEPLATSTAMFNGRNDFNVAGAAAVNSHTITVRFDAPPDSAQATTLANYTVVDASSSPLPISGTPTLSADMLSVTIATSAQSAGTYTVNVANVTRASDAEPLNIHSANFTGRTPFDVSTAMSTSSTTVAVTFDATPVTAQATDLANYGIPGLSLTAAALNGNTVTLTTSPQAGQPYTVSVANVTRLSDGEPLTVSSAIFNGRAPFDVTGAASLSSHSAIVTFDAPPNAAQAATAANYMIPGLTVTAASYPGSGNTVTLTTTAQSATTFTVTVSGVTRAIDSEPLTLAVASFAGRAPFDVSGAASVTSHSITVTFDAPPDPATAQTLGNYAANNGLTFSSASLSGSTVTLTTSAQMATTYQVTVANVKRASDAEPLTVNSASFMGRTPFDVAGASSTGNTTITVTFDAAPNMTQATTLGNYSITSGSLSLSGTPTLSGNTVTITTTAQTSGAGYTVAASGITRASDGEALTVASASFTGKSGFNVASASSVSTTSMSVTFDAAPDPTTATNVNNYSVPGLTLSGPVALAGNTVTMTTTAQAGQTYTVTVVNVVRASDLVGLTANTASFTHTTFNVASAAALNSHTMTVTFDALPNSAQAVTLSNYSVKDQMNNPLTLSGTPTLNTTTNTVTITTATQTGGKNYTVTVANVTRASDATVLTTKTASFTGIASFNVMSAASATSASMTVTFDAAPNPTQATTITNYSVPGLTLGGTPVLSGNTVTIATSVQTATTYTVTVNNVTRASDAEPLTTKTATFTGKAQSAPTVTNVVVQSTNPSNGTTFYNTGTATVVISGTQFTGVACPAGVTLDDQNGAGTTIKTAAMSCSVDSDTQITATFPTGIRTNGLTGWNVLVTNTVGTNLTSSVKLIVKAGLLVSEVQVGVSGNGNSTREFVEVYNPTANAIDVNALGLVVHFRNGSGNDITAPSFSILVGGNPSHKVIVSHGFWLVSSTQSSVAPDPWYAHRDATYDASMGDMQSSNGFVYLSLSATAQAKVIDKLGWGTPGTGGAEGTPISNISNGNTTNSVQRKPAGGQGDGTDSDNNFSDFNAQSSTITPNGTMDPVQP